MFKIGVLAVQGSFIEHIQAFEKLKVEAVDIRSPNDLTDDIQGLVIPGGESTTMGHFLKNNQFLLHIKHWMKSGKMVWGTCAGLILLANELKNEKYGGQFSLGGLNIVVERNSFGNLHLFY